MALAWCYNPFHTGVAARYRSFTSREGASVSDHDLKLNGLSRYAKESPRLVLEEYGHCEVPAGCGGVVLRWRNPDQPIPMVVHSFSGNGTLDYQGLDGTDTRFQSKLL